MSGVQSNPEPDLLGGGVFGDIVEGFLESEENAVPQPGIERMIGKILGDLEPARDAGQIQKTLRKKRVVAGQRSHRVILRIDGPDDFWRVGRDVPKSSKNAFQQIGKSLLFGLLRFGLQRIQCIHDQI